MPEAFRAYVQPGVRARVPVGRRSLVGMIISLAEEPPAGVDVIRPITAVLDREPLLTPELLELARFTADYYLAPLGEVLRAFLPAGLSAWGERRLRLTDAGAIAPPRSPEEEAVVAALRHAGRLSMSELLAQVGLAELDRTVAALAAAGRVVIEERGRTGARYVGAVDLAPGEVEELKRACGRSRPGRAVVDYLTAVGRPATIAEVQEAVGCSAAVVRRLISLGVLRRFTQVERLTLDHHLLRRGESAPIRLRPDQTAAVERLRGAVEEGGFRAFLLSGLTGSGKTEVYLRAVQEALARDRGAIILVPEIALVPALARTVQERFGASLAILHSALGVEERHQEWQRIRDGQARVVLGPRSAVLAPVEGLGLLVVDEEQDPSYKQETTPRYHGRDLALLRGQRLGAVTLLVSATPSLESRHGVEGGRLEPLVLTERVGQGSLPQGILVDLRAEGVVRRAGEVAFSERLRREISSALEAGDQLILLRNRRGYAPLLLCRACGEDMRCADCGLPRTYHRRERSLLCHYCGSRRPVPQRCPSCGEEAQEPVGAGTERVEERFQELFPGVTVGVLDRDTVRQRGGAAAVLERFARGETRVLVGTQMISKGHHFPRVALTAVLAADTYLSFPDFRAVERTYNLLTQIAGRAGRGERPGRVVIQTYHPEHYAIQAALHHDDRRFATEEMRFRRVFHYPPYTRLVQLLVSDRKRERAECQVARLARRLGAHPAAAGVRLSGPAPAPLERLRGKWRYQILLRHASARQLRRLVQEAALTDPPPGLTVDVDPQDLM